MNSPNEAPQTVQVPEIAYAEQVMLPPARSAVVVVDMQNDFVKPGGSLVVESAEATVGSIGRLLARARKAGVRIAYTQDSHFEGDKEWDLWPEHCRVGGWDLWPEHCRVGGWGWQIIEELRPEKGDLVCRKSRYDGFYGTWLEHHLCHVWGVRHLVLAGTVANICVLHTASSAALRWLDVAVAADAVSSLTDFDQLAALRQISWLYAGKVTRSVDDIRFSKND